jgi:hypothetical protein
MKPLTARERRWLRLAVACVAIGVIGLAVHVWLPVLALVALPSRRELAAIGGAR